MKFPRVRVNVNAHVYYFSLALIASVGSSLLVVKVFGQSEEDKIKFLQEKYADDLKNSSQKRAELQAFFDKMKNNENDDIFQEVLKGGKSDVKRQQIYQVIDKSNNNQASIVIKNDANEKS